MKKRFLLVITLILLALMIAVVPALAESGIEKGKPPKDTTTPTPPPIPDIGELYGDLYVVLRDVYGAPELDEHGCIVPIAGDDPDVFTIWDTEKELWYTTTTIYGTDQGDILVTAYAKEPFQLPYYTVEGDEVACELTEDMADWVQTVDFGRLNLGRAPDAVIDHALDEAINKMNTACAMGLDPAGRIMLDLAEDPQDMETSCAQTTRLVDWVTIDAPAENLALYIKMMTDGHWLIPEDTKTTGSGGDPEVVEYRPRLTPAAIRMIAGLDEGVYSNLVCVPDGTLPGDITEDFPTIIIDEKSGDYIVNDCIASDDNDLVVDFDVNALDVNDLQLAASLMAGAGDKFGQITLDMVVYINSIYEINQAANTENGVFNFGQYQYGDLGGRDGLYDGRIHIGTICVNPGEVYVLQPDDDTYTTFTAGCVLTTDVVVFHEYSEEYFFDGITVADDELNPEFVDYLEYVDNVRGFAQAADDALQVLEYVHNYSVPEVMPTPEPGE